MAISLSDNQVRLLHLRAQRIAFRQETCNDVASLMKDLCSIQAQDPLAARLAIRVRSTGLVADDVEHARIESRSIVRTWMQRGTLHLVATEDLNWLLSLFGPIFIAGDQRRRAELGLDEDTCARGIRIIRDVLANQGPMTRAELVEQLAIHGMRIEGQARPHLLSRAALEGIICFGPDRGTEPTYVLLSDWVDLRNSLPEESAYEELVRRYLKAYGPATPEDMATWSGLPMSKIRAAWQHIANQLIEVEIAGSSAWILKACASWLDESAAPSPIVRLLPGFDIYLLGYRNRALAISPQYAKRINAGGGIVHPTLLIDGQVIGTWKSKRKKNSLDVVVEPFDQFPPEIHEGLEAEIMDIARFLRVQVTTPTNMIVYTYYKYPLR